MDAADTHKEFFSITEVGARLNIGRTLIYELLGSGDLRSVKIGSRRLIARDEIERYIAKLKEEAA